MAEGTMYENSGVVYVVESKQFEGKNGRPPATLFSFQIEGTRRWFRCGRIKPKFQEGDFISFENDAKANVDMDTVQIGEGNDGGNGSSGGNGNRGDRGSTGGNPRASGGSGGSRGSRPAAASGGQSAGVTRDGYWANKEARDIEKDERYQNVDIPRMSWSAARSDAVRLVAAALENDCLALGQKKGDRLDILLGQVDEVTERFLMQNMNAGERYKELKENGPGLFTQEEVDESVTFSDMDEDFDDE